MIVRRHLCATLGMEGDSGHSTVPQKASPIRWFKLMGAAFQLLEGGTAIVDTMVHDEVAMTMAEDAAFDIDKHALDSECYKVHGRFVCPQDLFI